jgi:hypothetical protein
MITVHPYYAISLRLRVALHARGVTGVEYLANVWKQSLLYPTSPEG